MPSSNDNNSTINLFFLSLCKPEMFLYTWPIYTYEIQFFYIKKSIRLFFFLKKKKIIANFYVSFRQSLEGGTFCDPNLLEKFKF